MLEMIEKLAAAIEAPQKSSTRRDLIAEVRVLVKQAKDLQASQAVSEEVTLDA